MDDFIEAWRLVVFTPQDARDRLIDKICALIPPLGHYDRVAWWCEGMEQFRPLPGSDPALGKIYKTETALSIRLEFTMPQDESLLHKIINEAILPHHPWEKPVILVFSHRLWQKP